MWENKKVKQENKKVKQESCKRSYGIEEGLCVQSDSRCRQNESHQSIQAVLEWLDIFNWTARYEVGFVVKHGLQFKKFYYL